MISASSKVPLAVLSIFRQKLLQVPVRIRVNNCGIDHVVVEESNTKDFFLLIQHIL